MSGPAPDLILRGARIWSGLGADPDAPPGSIAIFQGRIVAIGSDSEIAEQVGPATRVLDVGGRRVIPGLIDCHIHAVRAGLTYLDEADWVEVESVVDALRLLRATAATRERGEWVTSLGGWHPTQFVERRMPTKRELDEAAPHNPVFVHPVYGYADYGVLNAAALRALGWDTPGNGPTSGVLHRDVDGAPDGRLSGVDAYQEVLRVAQLTTPQRAAASTEAFFLRLAQLGLTGVIDAGGLGMAPARYSTLRDVWHAGRLPIRVRLNVGAVTRGEEHQEVAAWRQLLQQGSGDDLLSVLGTGEVLHFGAHDWEGMSPFEISDDSAAAFLQILSESADHRWPVTVHAILDSSISHILDAMEEVARRTDISELRWSLCHVECISERNLDRVRDLGLALSLQSRIGHKHADCAARWGLETIRQAPPLGDVLRLGIPFAAGTDATRAASYNPWRALWWFVTGRGMDGGPRRDEPHRLDRATALDAYTRGSAWLSFDDDRRGTLRVGADADIAVLSDDYFTVAESEIPRITSELTLVGGRVVHAGAEFGTVVEPTR